MCENFDNIQAQSSTTGGFMVAQDRTFAPEC